MTSTHSRIVFGERTVISKDILTCSLERNSMSTRRLIKLINKPNRKTLHALENKCSQALYCTKL